MAEQPQPATDELAAASVALSDHPSARAVQEKFGDAVEEIISYRGETTIRVANAVAHDVLRFLRDDPAHAYDMLIDMTAVDWRVRRPRFDVVYQLYSTRNRDQLRVKSGVNAIESGDSIPTSADLWSSGNWLERECYDMFGINFAGHPDLRRILLPEDWNEGYPLRKDYPLRGHKQWGQYH